MSSLPRPFGPASLAEQRAEQEANRRQLENLPRVLMNVSVVETEPERLVREAKENIASAPDYRSAPRKFIDAVWAGARQILQRDHQLDFPHEREQVGWTRTLYDRAHRAADAFCSVAQAGVAGPTLEVAKDGFQQAVADWINRVAADAAAAKVAAREFERSAWR